MKKILRNALSNWVGYAVHLIVALALTPYVLHSIGAERYSVWVLVTGLTGYYGLLDLGLRSAITQYLVRNIASEDCQGVNRTASTAMAMLSIATFLILVCAGLTIGLAPHVFPAIEPFKTEMRWCIAALGTALCVQVLCSPYASVFVALERFDLATLIGLVTRLATAVGIVAVLYLGYGLIGLSFVIAIGNIGDSLIRRYGAYRLLPQLQISLAKVKWSEMQLLGSFSAWNIVGQSSQRLTYFSDEIVIALFMPLAYVAPYAIAVAVANQFASCFQPLASVLYPVATQMDAKGERDRLSALYQQSTRALLVLAVTVGLIAATWSSDFFRLWVGQEFAEKTGQTSVATLFLLLLLAAVFTAGQRVGYQVLMGMGELRCLALLVVSEGIANLVLSVVLVQKYGTLGVAIGTLIPALAFHAIAHPLVLCKVLEIPRLQFFRQVYARSALYGAIIGAVLLCEHTLLPPASSWPRLVLHGALALVLAAPLAAVFGLDRFERSRLLYLPISRLARRVSLA